MEDKDKEERAVDVEKSFGKENGNNTPIEEMKDNNDQQTSTDSIATDKTNNMRNNSANKQASGNKRKSADCDEGGGDKGKNKEAAKRGRPMGRGARKPKQKGGAVRGGGGRGTKASRKPPTSNKKDQANAKTNDKGHNASKPSKTPPTPGLTPSTVRFRSKSTGLTYLIPSSSASHRSPPPATPSPVDVSRPADGSTPTAMMNPPKRTSGRQHWSVRGLIISQ